MRKTQITLIAVLLAAGAGYSALLTQDFTGQPVGSNPTGTTYIGTTAITATSFIKVVGSTPMGPGNGLQIRDNDTANFGLEYNFTAASAVKVSLAFSPIAGGSATAYMTFAVGQNEVSTSQRLSASSRRYAEMRFYGDGDLRFYFNGAFVDYNDLLGDSVNTLTCFLNDYNSQSVNYTVGSTSYTLPANSVAWWVNDILILNSGSQYGSLDVADVTTIVGSTTNTVGTSEGNLGRIGFSETSITGMDYYFDDLIVSQIPEPATIGMLMFGALALLAVRRHPGRLSRRD